MKTAAADNLSQDRHIYIHTDRQTDRHVYVYNDAYSDTSEWTTGHEFIDRMENQGSLLP